MLNPKLLSVYTLNASLINISDVMQTFHMHYLNCQRPAREDTAPISLIDEEISLRILVTFPVAGGLTQDLNKGSVLSLLSEVFFKLV